MNVYVPPPPRRTWRTTLELIVGLVGLSLVGAVRLAVILSALGFWVALAWIILG